MEKYYIKHLLRTVKKRPQQPLLMIFILALSFVMLVFSFAAADGIKTEEEMRTVASYGNADAVVKTGSASPSRFLFAEDAEKTFPGAAVTSSFAMPFLKGERIVAGAAVPFATVGEIFTLNFSEYASFGKGEKKSVCFVSRSFADEYGLSVGDALTLEAFGDEVRFTVKGISETPFLGTYDVLTDISSAIGILLGDPAVSAILGENFTPGGTLYVKFPDGADVAACLSALRAEYDDYNVFSTKQDAVSIDNEALQAINVLIVLFTVVAAFAVIYCCLFCMTEERAEHAELFSLCGVTKKELLRLQVAEIALYGLIGVGMGILLSLPVCRAAFRGIGFEFVTYRLTWRTVLPPAAAVLAVALLTPLLPHGKKTRKTGRKTARLPLLLPPFCAVLLFVLIFFLPGESRFLPGAFCILILLLSVAVLAPVLFRLYPRTVAKKGKFSPFGIGCRNCLRVPALSNTARLLAILFVVLTVAFYGIDISSRYTAAAPGAFFADLAVSGGTMRVREPVEALPETAIVSGFASAEGELNGKQTRGWAFEKKEAAGSRIMLDSLPKGDEVFCSYAFSCQYGLHEGDRVTLTLNAVAKEVTVSKILNHSGAFAFIFDTEYYGIPYDTYLVKAADGVSYNELYRAVTGTLSTETVTVTSTGALVESVVKSNAMYVFFGRIALALLGLFAALGIADNLIESFRTRKEERGHFRIAGLDRRGLRRMHTAELFYTLIFAAVMALPGVIAVLVVGREALLSYGTDAYVLYF